MDTKLKNNPKKNKFLWVILLVCLAAAVLYMVRLPYFKSIAKQYYANPLESEEMAGELYKSAYVLYRDLYEKVNQEPKSFADLYIEYEIRQQKEPDNDTYYSYIYRDGSFEISTNHTGYVYPDDEALIVTDEFESKSMTQEEAVEYCIDYIMKSAQENFSDSYAAVGKVFDYYIVDNKTGTYISNSTEDFGNREDFRYLVKITYDANGNLSPIEVQCEDESAYMKVLTETGRKKGEFAYYDFSDLEEKLGAEFHLLTPRDCTVYFGLTNENMESITESPFWSQYSSWWQKYSAYQSSGIEGWLWLLFVAVVILAFFLPIGEKIWDRKLFRLPLEAVLLLLLITLEIGTGNGAILAQNIRYCEGETAESFRTLFGNLHLFVSINTFMAWLWNLFIVFVYFAVLAYCVLCLREIRDVGILPYLKKRSYIYRFFPFIKRKVKQAYAYFTGFDISTDSNKVIIRLLIANGILVSFFTLFWFGGVFAVLVYSVILYFVMRKYLSDMKKKYEVLLRATNQIAEGNLNVKITENLGMFEPFRPQIEKIQDGFKTAVEEEVKSQRMKTELITNVSHDLKTPLTAIITYINLLKEEGVTEEQRKEYLDTLERKSLRLKVLIEDLFEVSKANSRTISLSPVDVDIVDLLKQVNFELEEKIKAANLDVRLQSSGEKVVVKLDSQKTYRIYENLVNNIAKYAMPGTRVYMSVEKQEDRVTVELKNISAQEIECTPEELMERFVRGDASRNTEGSGLGLAIAKSFVEMQGGRMGIRLDGDLFKVITEWPLSSKSEE